jgi:hypothetical protein
VVQDFTGLKVDLTADPPTITLRPSLPVAWPDLRVRTRIGKHDCLLEGSGTDPHHVVVRFSRRPPLKWKFVWETAAAGTRQGKVEIDRDAPEGWDFRVVWKK